MKGFVNFIFDLDGTLIDSNPSHDKAFKIALRESSVPSKSSEFNYEKMKGKKTLDVMLELGFSLREAENLTLIKQESYRKLLSAGEVIVFPGVIECFEYLKYLGKKVFICTGASRTSVDIIIDKFAFNSFLDGYITGSDVSEAKPSPMILNNLLAENHLNYKECIFVEDSLNGKLCGERANVYTVIVNNPDIQGSGDFTSFKEFYDKLRVLNDR